VCGGEIREKEGKKDRYERDRRREKKNEKQKGGRERERERERTTDGVLPCYPGCSQIPELS
jgi:hypothetical protein